MIIPKKTNQTAFDNPWVKQQYIDTIREIFRAGPDGLILTDHQVAALEKKKAAQARRTKLDTTNIIHRIHFSCI